MFESYLDYCLTQYSKLGRSHKANKELCCLENWHWWQSCQLCQAGLITALLFSHTLIHTSIYIYYYAVLYMCEHSLMKTLGESGCKNE